MQKLIPEIHGTLGAEPCIDSRSKKPYRGYKIIINEHYGTDLNANEVAAFSVLLYNWEHYEK